MVNLFGLQLAKNKSKFSGNLNMFLSKKSRAVIGQKGLVYLFPNIVKKKKCDFYEYVKFVKYIVLL